MQHLNNFKVCEFSFTVLSYLGVWRPVSMKSLWAIRLYNFWTITIILHTFYFSTTFFIYICNNKHNTEIFAENVLVFTNTFLLALKLTYFNYRKQDVNSLVKLFLQKENLPRNIEEDSMYKNFQVKERFIERLFLIPTIFTFIINGILPLLNRNTISFPMKRWKPYAINSGTIFWTTYTYDSIIGCFAVLAYASCESLTIIFMQQICIHLDILLYRLLKIQNIKQNTNEETDIYQQECNLIKNCVDHHLRIFVMEKTLNETFGLVMFFQFFVSILNLCTCCLCLTEMKLNNESSCYLFVLMICFLSQIFIYCFTGEELTRKSLSVSDEIYKMDWTLLTTQTKEHLMLMMLRSSQPIQLTGGSVITLSIDTFLKVVKASYSSFNLLRQTK